jgi:AcrR family transcriptional regulator
MTATLRKYLPKVSAAPRRRGSLEEVLIEAAMDLFASYGYRGTSLSRIARAAGVTKGALYWHFADKEEFFVAVARRVLAEWNQAFRARPVARDATDYAQAFLRTFGTLADLNENNPWVSRLLLIITLESHKIGPRVLRMMRKENLRGFDGLHKLIRRGITLGALDPALDEQWAATEIFANYLGLATLWYLHGERFSLRRSLDRVAREFLRRWSNPR